MSTVYNLPEEMKEYELIMSDKSNYIITAQEKAGILKSKTQFIELQTGEVINKSFIVCMKLYKDGTRHNFNVLAQPDKKKLIDEINTSQKKVRDRSLDIYSQYGL